MNHPHDHAIQRPDEHSERLGAFRPVLLLLGAAVVLAGGLTVNAAPAPITVSDGWFRFVTAQVPAGGYMRLSNQSPNPAVLLGANSPACGMIMLHRSETSGGADTMRPVQQVAIPAKGSISFDPGGYHLMCMQPRMAPGQTISVTLTLDGGRTVTAPFAVFGASGKPVRQ